MNEAQKRMLAEVNKRLDANFAFKGFGSGLNIAGQYMKGWFDCIDSKQCNYLEGKDLAAAQKHASEMLTWLDPSQGFASDAATRDGESKEWVDASASLKKFKLPEGIEVPKNSLMVFRNIITTNEEDRDGDVLHTEGAKLDTPMPLLWQHNSSLPIGKMLAVDEHTPKRLRVISVLLDMNDLTEDTAKLIEAGVLRISHGFIPLKYEERSEDSKNVPWKGFDIKEFEVMEESTVSVPSNRGAIIDMFTRDAFKSAPMKTIGKALHDDRTDKVWPGFRKFDVPDDTKPSSKDGSVDKDGQPVAGKDSCGCGGKKKGSDVATKLTLKLGELEQSVEFKGDKVSPEQLEELKAVLTGEKGGRSLSKATIKTIEDVITDLDAVKDDEDMSRGNQALVVRSIGTLKELIEKAQPEDPIEGEDPLLPDGEQAPKHVRGLVKRLQKGAWVEIEGSREAKQQSLHDAVEKALTSNSVMGKDDHSYIVATFPGKCVAGVWLRSTTDERFYEMEFKETEDGFEVTTEPKQVELKAVVAPAETNDEVKSPMQTALSMIMFNAEGDDLQKLFEAVEARKAVEQSIADGSEYRELVGN